MLGLGVGLGGGDNVGVAAAGFREILVDQPFSGKWMDVDMNLGGGHYTFQGTKFSDWAGGFSYKNNNASSAKSSTKGVTAYRSIHWRTLNDTLELCEISLHLNLIDNQVRYIFQGSPIVGPITIQETETNVIILVATLTSVNRFVFVHPNRVAAGVDVDKNRSIFHQITNPPVMNFRSFNLYEHAMNIPVPLSATCAYVEQRGGVNHSRSRFSAKEMTLTPTLVGGECLFAYSFESGSINVYKISKDDILTRYDLRQANIFTRLFSGLTTSIMRTPTAILDAVIGLSFFFSSSKGVITTHIVTLAMNGQLNLWSCPNLDNFTEWNSYHCGVVDNRFAVDSYIDSCMLLRKSEDADHPSFAIHIPGDGFRLYKLQKLTGTTNTSQGGNALSQNSPKFQLVMKQRIEFVDRDVMDFCLTSDHIFTLVNNPDEEMEWAINSYRLDEPNSSSRKNHPSFTSALLEPLPAPDVEPNTEAKEFYMSLIFNNSSFTATTIMKALTMFRKDEDKPIRPDIDWDSLRITAMNMIDREIALATSDTEFDISDEDYTELSLKFWGMFYNSCVEYHIHTVKPLGLFFESNSNMVCVVKKSRISFLRPTSFLETLYYFPHSLNLSTSHTHPESDEYDEFRKDIVSVTRYLSIVKSLEDIFNDSHISKIEKQLRQNISQLQDVCKEIANFLLSTDPHCFATVERQLVQVLCSKLQQLGGNAEIAMKKTLDLISSWDQGDSAGADDENASTFYMGSRLGVHVTHKILQQLMQHKFMIARDTIVLQYMVTSFFASRDDTELGGGDGDSNSIAVSWGDQEDAKWTTSAYFALMDVTETYIERVPDFVRERGLKVANILKLAISSDSSTRGGGSDEFDSFWPIKLLEGFCLSTVGSHAIRARLSLSSGGGCSALAHAEATGRCIWTNSFQDNTRPLEDYLIVSCQYNILTTYANFMVHYFSNNKAHMKDFYLGLSKLCLFNEDVGLAHLCSINLKSAVLDEYFCSRVLQLDLPIEGAISLFNSYYVRVISILQVLEYLHGVRRMAMEGFHAAATEEEAIKMCTLAFKCAIQLDDYNEAYDYVMKIPTTAESGSQEKLASLRTFIGHLVRKGEMDTLLGLSMDELFNKSSSIREQIEGILFAQANLADPLEPVGAYQMLYVFHLANDHFHKAASTMYYKAMRIGDKCTGRDALLAQKACYLDVMTCLSLVTPTDCQFVVKKTGIVRDVLKEVKCFNPELAGKAEEILTVPCVPWEREFVVVDMPEIRKEMFVLIMLAELEDDTPVKPMDFERRAIRTVDMLRLCHRYDDAFKLAFLWGIDPTPIIAYFTDVCCNLVHNVMPKGGDPGVYFRHVDTSDLASSSETSYTELGFRLLEKYLNQEEKPRESCLHNAITLKLLMADVELPQWLIASYKKRNVAQLLRCLIRYAEWEKATELALKILDAALGRVKCDEFDSTVKKISSYDPIEPSGLPLNYISDLSGALKEYGKANPSLIKLNETLTERASLFCDRVIACTNERNIMFAVDRK